MVDINIMVETAPSVFRRYLRKGDANDGPKGYNGIIDTKAEADTAAAECIKENGSSCEKFLEFLERSGYSSYRAIPEISVVLTPSAEKGKAKKVESMNFGRFLDEKEIYPFNGADITWEAYSGKISELSMMHIETNPNKDRNDSGVAFFLYRPGNIISNIVSAILQKPTIKGTLCFKYSGEVDGGDRNNAFSVMFIKAGPFGDYTKDQVLKEESFNPSDSYPRESASIEIPAGANKFNIMLIGKGYMRIFLRDLTVVNSK